MALEILEVFHFFLKCKLYLWTQSGLLGRGRCSDDLDIYHFSGHWSAGTQRRKTRKTSRERMQYKSRKQVTLKKRKGYGLERLNEEGRIEHRARTGWKTRFKRREDRKKAKKHGDEKRTGEGRINGKTRKAKRYMRKYLGKTPYSERERTNGVKKSVRESQGNS